MNSTVVLPRHSFILWLSILGRLATVDRLARFGVIVDDQCALCGANKESLEYLFFRCSYSLEVWMKTLNWLNIQRNVSPWNDEVMWVTNQVKGRSAKASILACCFAATVYSIWKAPNDTRFLGVKKSVGIIYRELVQLIHVRGSSFCKWKPMLSGLNHYA